MALIPFDTLVLFMTAALALNLTPGPDMLFCLGSGVSRGPKAGIAAALGVSAGAMVHTAAAAFGLAGLLMASPTLFEIIRWVGAAYLVWLAWTTWRAPPLIPHQQNPHGKPVTGHLFLRGAVTNILNPKVAIFFVAFLPHFIDPARGSVVVQALILGTLMNMSGTVVNALVGAGAGGLGQRLAQNPIAPRLLNRFSATIFLGLAVRLGLLSRA
ncbi:LysE family translocator [Niveispirillum irakense]|uniref:LysE family translocator n=1 Tax=Niveispirillum irakense TaxID=34011 RepID=UPI00040159DF|nr:LysE family translocator [Niveispirillum irakense]